MDRTRQYYAQHDSFICIGLGTSLHSRFLSESGGFGSLGPMRFGPIRVGPIRVVPIRVGPIRVGPIRVGPIRVGVRVTPYIYIGWVQDASWG